MEKRWSEQMHSVELLLEEWVYPNLDRGRLLREFNPVDDGNRYQVTCPHCHKRSARIYKTGVILFCECGYFRDVMSFMKEQYALNDYEAFKELSYMAGCPEVMALHSSASEGLVKR